MQHCKAAAKRAQKKGLRWSQIHLPHLPLDKTFETGHEQDGSCSNGTWPSSCHLEWPSICGNDYWHCLTDVSCIFQGRHTCKIRFTSPVWCGPGNIQWRTGNNTSQHRCIARTSRTSRFSGELQCEGGTLPSLRKGQVASASLAKAFIECQILMVESNGEKKYLFLAGFDGDPSRRPWRSVHQGAICRCFVFVGFLFRMVTVDLPFEKFEEVEFAWNMAFNFMTATMISGLRSLVLGKHQVDLEIEDFKHFLGFIKEKTSSFEEMIKIQEHFSGLKFTTHVDSEFTIISFGDDPNLEVTFLAENWGSAQNAVRSRQAEFLGKVWFLAVLRHVFSWS